MGLAVLGHHNINPHCSGIFLATPQSGHLQESEGGTEQARPNHKDQDIRKWGATTADLVSGCNVRGQKRFQKNLNLSFGCGLKMYNSLGRQCVESTGALRSFSGLIALSGPKPQCSPGGEENKNDDLAVGMGVFARMNRSA